MKKHTPQIKLITKRMRSLKHFFTASLHLFLFLSISVPLCHFISSTSAHAAFSSKSAGTSGAAFLKIGAGARPSAMGNAFTAVADDVNALYWNSAGLATLREKNEFVAMRADLFQDIKYNVFAFAHPTKNHGTIAIGLNNLNITSIEQRTGDTENPDSTFSSNDTAYTLGYGMKLAIAGLPSYDQNHGLHLGVALKAIRQTLSGSQANSFGADLGSLYQFESLPLGIGLSIQNFGSKPTFKTESDPLPLTLNLGSSYRMGEKWKFSGLQGSEGEKVGLISALDLYMPRDNDPSLRFGTEYTVGWSINIRSALRLGYQTGRSRQNAGTTSGISAGFGGSYKFFTFDFAWIPFGDLGNTFRYSIKIRF